MQSTATDETVTSRLDRFVEVKAAADLLSLSHHYLNRLRVTGGGPPYSTFGRAVRYRVGDLFAWAASKSATSSSTRDPQ